MKRMLLAAAAALAGCAGPRPDPPREAQVMPPGIWHRPDAGSEGVQADWWRSFGDPVLAALVERALVDNVDVAIAAARIDEAMADFRFARAQQHPDVAATAAGGRQRSVDAFGRAIEQDAGQAQLSLGFDLDLSGRLRAASAAARAALAATQDARDAVRLAVAASTAAGYVMLRALDARLAVLRNTLTARIASEHLARRRFDAGYGAALDLRQAEAERRAAEQAIPAAELAIARQEHGLRVLLGTTPGTLERGVPLDGLRLPRPAAGLPAELLRRRPDIAQAEAQLAATDHALDAARAAFLPNVQLTAAGGYVASSLLSDPVAVFSTGGSVLAPLFDAGRLRARQSAAAARRDQAAFAFRKTVLAAFRDVEDALAAVRGTQAQERALAAQREAASAVLAIATRRYREGYSPYLEQLDAERSLLSAELALVQARSDRLLAVIALYQSLGGGWAPSAEDTGAGE